MTRWQRAFKILWQLGPGPVTLYLRYWLGVRSGWYRWQTRHAPAAAPGPWRLPGRFPAADALQGHLDADARRAALQEADRLLEGYFRPFSGLPAPLDLSQGTDPRHWVQLERDHRWLQGQDIKFIWEPARLSWVFTLGRAYHLSGDRRYAAFFWRKVAEFRRLHPPYRGAQWMNGQEVALRMLALAWGGALFSPPPGDCNLAALLAAHAYRVEVTLVYARAQQSNHLMSEAAALWTAGLLLPRHPRAGRWLRQGRRWFLWAVQHHIDPQRGEYIHHSVNYHRFILQLALWLRWLQGRPLHPQAEKHLRAAARWLAECTDPLSGDAPNWGSNDGAYIFPLAAGGFRDFRPVAQAAMRAFAGQPAFAPGPWDEMSLWFGLPVDGQAAASQPLAPMAFAWPAANGRFFLRLGQGNWRLGHADFLHLDFWQEGRNLLLDSGTYLYNGQPPWDNPWPRADFHNTLTVNGQDQMTRAGRFMYLDWAQARLTKRTKSLLAAETNAWRRFGLLHRRRLVLQGEQVLLEDSLEPTKPMQTGQELVRLHFLLADWPFDLQKEGQRLIFRLWLPTGAWQLQLPAQPVRWSLVRGGEILDGVCAQPQLRGWYSPTYALKVPALSLAAEYRLPLPIHLRTRFQWFPLSDKR